MLPASLCTVGYQSIQHPSDHPDVLAAPSGPTLSSVAARMSAPGPLTLATLPTMLLHLIKTWLTMPESLQLILTSHALSNEVQNYYRVRLRPAVAEQAKSPIASFQESINCRPSILKIEAQGEKIFQQCLVLKERCQSEEEYRNAALTLLKDCLPHMTDPGQLSEVAAGVGLGLGGTLMNQVTCDALFACILHPYKTSPNSQMGSLIIGVCCALGGPYMKHAHLRMVLRKILASCQTSRPGQMGGMIMGISIGVGSANKTRALLQILVDEILTAHPAISTEQMASMMHSVCHIFRGQEMRAADRDFILAKVRDWLSSKKPQHTTGMIHGLCSGLGATELTRENLDLVLTLIMDFHASWEPVRMAQAIGTVCMVLGGMAMVPDRRDVVLAKIMASTAICSAMQVGTMICSVCHALGGSVTGPSNNITPVNLHAILNCALVSHPTRSRAQLGSMICYLFRALGGSNIKRCHWEIMVGRIRKSGQLRAILAELKQIAGGKAIADLILSKNGPD